MIFIGSGPGPVRNFGTERALVEPLGPNTGNSRTPGPKMATSGVGVRELPEAHTFDFIGT